MNNLDQKICDDFLIYPICRYNKLLVTENSVDCLECGHVFKSKKGNTCNDTGF